MSCKKRKSEKQQKEKKKKKKREGRGSIVIVIRLQAYPIGIVRPFGSAFPYSRALERSIKIAKPPISRGKSPGAIETSDIRIILSNRGVFSMAI
jgi:hypothetical protein